jgi:hypothetical protein
VTIGALFAVVAQARSADPVSDATPPAGKVSLPAVVNTSEVTITLDLGDPESGLVAVRVSNDGATFGEWTAPPSPPAGGTVSVLPWVLSDGDGPKTVTVEARNGGGAVSSFTATTALDTAPPLVMGSEPPSGAALAAPPTVIVVHYSEPLALSPLPTAVMPGGPLFTVTVSGADVKLKPRRAIVPGAAYQLTLEGVCDLAGNTAAPAQVDFTVEKVFDKNSLPSLTTIYNLSSPWHTNSGAFTVRDSITGLTLTLSAGECLFKGAEFGEPRGDFGVLFSYDFSSLPNATGLSVGSIGGISKKGHEYMWVRYERAEIGSLKVLGQKPKAVYVEKVYKDGDFSALNLS